MQQKFCQCPTYLRNRWSSIYNTIILSKDFYFIYSPLSDIHFREVSTSACLTSKMFLGCSNKYNVTMFTSNHLGVTFSVDGKWSKHINNVAKAYRQIVVLHKIIFNVSRNFLEIFTWHSLGNFWNILVKFGTIELLTMLIRLEAAKIVTGLTAYANLPSLYAETRWGKLNTRFQIRKLSLFYNIDKDDTHNYLSDLLPHTVNRAIINNLWNANNFTIPRCRLTL